MSTTLNLPCVRFVKRVTNGALFSKYSYLSMMAQNAAALESAPWRMAETPIREVTMPVNKVTQTDAEYDESGVMTKSPSFTAFTSDAFDAYQQGGDARAETAMMCGYAGCVAYRFNMPASASSVPLESISLLISRDRYCRAGVRVAVVLSNDAAPSNDWAVVRGTGSGAIVSAHTSSEDDGVASWGFLAQSEIGNLISSRAAESTLVFTASSFPALATTGKTYLWVYLTLEDYTSFWLMYNAKEPRYYSIEGSARLVAAASSFVFSSTVTGDAESWTQAQPMTQDLPLAHMYVTEQGITPAQLTRYGSLLLTRMASAALFTDSNSPVSIALAASGLKSKAMFDGNTYPFGQTAPISMKHAEMGIIAGTRQPLEIDAVSGNYFRADTTTFKIYAEIAHYGSPLLPGGFDGANGDAYANAWIAWRYRPYCVPSGKQSYTRMKITVGASCNVSQGMYCDLLVWKTASPDCYGPFYTAAFAALAGNPAFFTGSASSVSGTFTGDGEDAVSVTASASLIQRLDFSVVATGDYVFDLDSAVKPGEVLIFVPSVKIGTHDASNQADKISFDIDQPSIYFA